MAGPVPTFCVVVTVTSVSVRTGTVVLLCTLALLIGTVRALQQYLSLESIFSILHTVHNLSS